MTILEKALQKAGHEMRLGVFYPLGGGNEVFHLRAVTIESFLFIIVSNSATLNERCSNSF